MSLDVADLRVAITRLQVAAELDFDELNRRDGEIGDGDLGITLKRGMALVAEQADELPDDMGRALMQCAQAFTKTSGSSYGTLLATGLMSVAKALKGETTVEPARMGELVGMARDAMQARGKAEFGGKTVLDSLNAVAQAIDGLREPSAIADAASRAVDDALDAQRNVQATIGRARIFGEKTIGMDDPGMVAMQRLVKAMVDR